MDKVNLTEKFDAIRTYWDPHVAATLNGQHVRLAKLKGEFVWHAHPNEDELFYVVAGRLRIDFRDGAVTLDEGELLVVPRGVEHRPVAEQEAHVMLFEPIATVNTGDRVNERTVRELKQV